MEKSTVTILVTDYGISKKDKKPFVTFLVANEKYGRWAKNKLSDGTYGSYFMFVTDEEYNFVKDNILNCPVMEAELEANGLRNEPVRIIID